MVNIALSKNALEPRMQYRIQLWCGAALNICGALYAVGLVVVARLVFPVPNPNASAIEIAAFFAQNSDRIRLGALIMVIGIGFFAPWGAMLVARTRLLEGSLPIFTYMSATTFGATLLATFLVPACFAIAAFRTWTTPEIPQMLNDAAWYLLLYIWPLFTVWIFSFGIPILTAPTSTLGRILQPHLWGAFWHLIPRESRQDRTIRLRRILRRIRSGGRAGPLGDRSRN
jgi:hypothetical protein